MKKQQATTTQASAQKASGNQVTEQAVPSGQARMVRQAERDEVETLLRQRAAVKSAEAPAKWGKS